MAEESLPKSDPWKGFRFPRDTTDLQRHMYAGGKDICSGAFFHRKAAIQAIWQGVGIVWHPWMDRALKSFCDYNWVTWTGPAASAKSFNASLLGLLYWLEYPEGTSVIMASTTRDALSRRLWYYVQDLHAKIRPRPDLTIGQALYSEYMIRLRAGDKKNGVFGLAIEDGPVEESLHNLIGYHNQRVMLVVDEAQGTREAIFQATDNLAKNPEFKCLLLGNAESREDPHGRFSEPLGGWISVDPDSTEQWETRGGPARGVGCCVFFDGRKSPAITEPGGAKKFPFLINQRQIDDALAYHGSNEHPRFWSQSIGFWPPVGITQTVLDMAEERSRSLFEKKDRSRYGTTITYLPRTRISGFKIQERRRFRVLELEAHTAHGTEKFRGLFATECQEEVSRLLCQARAGQSTSVTEIRG